jgi:hypothetical protein
MRAPVRSSATRIRFPRAAKSLFPSANLELTDIVYTSGPPRGRGTDDPTGPRGRTTTWKVGSLTCGRSIREGAFPLVSDFREHPTTTTRTGSRMKAYLRYAAASHRGFDRENNEDSVYAGRRLLSAVADAPA